MEAEGRSTRCPFLCVSVAAGGDFWDRADRRGWLLERAAGEGLKVVEGILR
jgi:hypothetical protein